MSTENGILRVDPIDLLNNYVLTLTPEAMNDIIVALRQALPSQPLHWTTSFYSMLIELQEATRQDYTPPEPKPEPLTEPTKIGTIVEIDSDLALSGRGTTVLLPWPGYPNNSPRWLELCFGDYHIVSWDEIASRNPKVVNP